MADLTTQQFEQAKARGEASGHGPRAMTAHYDAGRNRVVIRLTTGFEIGFAPRDAQGLQDASSNDLKTIEITEFGLGIHFPQIDADLYVPALLAGALGSRKWMAAQLGAAGGRTKTPAKAEAARANGRRGGRPRKLGTQEKG